LPTLTLKNNLNFHNNVSNNRPIYRIKSPASDLILENYIVTGPYWNIKNLEISMTNCGNQRYSHGVILNSTIVLRQIKVPWNVMSPVRNTDKNVGSWRHRLFCTVMVTDTCTRNWRQQAVLWRTERRYEWKSYTRRHFDIEHTLKYGLWHTMKTQWGSRSKALHFL
jgi:hypothetical protein